MGGGAVGIIAAVHGCGAADAIIVDNVTVAEALSEKAWITGGAVAFGVAVANAGNADHRRRLCRR